MKNLLWCLLALGFVLNSSVSAQPELDTTFNFTGIQTTSFGFAASGSDIVIQPDNKIVMVSSCTPSGSTSQQCVARYNEDGSPDLSFGVQGLVVNSGVGSGRMVALQSDGKIVVGGGKRIDYSFPIYGVSITLSRYTAEGVLDSSFGGGS